MDSASQPDNPPDTPHPADTPHSRVAVFIGAVIALATLVLPIFAIASFSPARVSPLEASQYPLFPPQE